MFDIGLAQDEKFIAEFHPPERAAFYSIIKNSPISLLIICVLLYYLLTGLYTYGIGSSKISKGIPQGQILNQVPSLNQDKLVISKSWQFSYTSNDSSSSSLSNAISNTFPSLKKYFLIALGFFLGMFIYLKVKKHRVLLALTSSKLTNKRVITDTVFGTGEKQSIYFSKQKYCFIKQTAIHRLFNIYYIFFSNNPNDWASPLRKEFRLEGIIDILTKEQAEIILKCFNHSMASAQGWPSTESTQNYLNIEDIGSINPALEPTFLDSNEMTIFQISRYYFFISVFQFFFRFAVLFMMYFLIIALNLHLPFTVNVVNFLETNVINYPQQALIGYVLFFIALSSVMAWLHIKLSKLIFTKTDIVWAKWPRFSPIRPIPYRDIVNVIVFRSYNFHHVNIIGAGNTRFKIAGLSKENAEKIAALLNRNCLRSKP